MIAMIKRTRLTASTNCSYGLMGLDILLMIWWLPAGSITSSFFLKKLYKLKLPPQLSLPARFVMELLPLLSEYYLTNLILQLAKESLGTLQVWSWLWLVSSLFSVVLKVKLLILNTLFIQFFQDYSTWDGLLYKSVT